MTLRKHQSTPPLKSSARRLRLFTLGEDVNGSVIGLKRVVVQDPKAFVREIQEKFPSLIIQVVESRFIGGLTHARLIMQQSWESRKRQLTFARKPDLDLLLRIALGTQISEALKRVGVRRGTVDLAILAMGPRHDLQMLHEYCKKTWTVNDEVIALSKRKEKFLQKFHRITEESTKNTTVKEEVLAYLLSEKAVLLGVRM